MWPMLETRETAASLQAWIAQTKPSPVLTKQPTQLAQDSQRASWQPMGRALSAVATLMLSVGRLPPAPELKLMARTVLPATRGRLALDWLQTALLLKAARS